MVDVSLVKEISDAVRREIHRAIVNMDEAIDALLIAMLSEGHVLIEGVPGLAKTYLAKYFSRALSLEFKRIQFTPDLLPSDIVGSMIYDRNKSAFVFRRGPIFANVILADEINRGAPRTQSALLEAMQERQVTIEGEVHPLPRPFLVIATQNPIELEGTYPLPEAQLDRFLLRVLVSHPSREEEISILRMKHEEGEEVEIRPVASRDDILRCMEVARRIHVEEDLLGYIVDIVRRTREDSQILFGGSTRAEVALLYAAKAAAAISGSPYLLPDHVKYVAPLVLNHRIIVITRGRQRFKSSSEAALIKELLESVGAPR